MAIPPIGVAQVIFFFQDSTGYGWSERFWYNSTTADPAFTNNLLALANARVAILTNTCFLTHIRVQSNLRRAPYVIKLAAGGLPGGETPPTAPSEVALLFITQAATPSPLKNRAFLRGIPERVVGGDNYGPDSTFLANLAFFTTVLQNGLWNIVSTIQSLPPAPIPIAALHGTVPRGYSFTAAVSSFGLGATVRVTGTKVPGYAGLKQVVGVDTTGTIYTVGGSAPPVADTGIAPKATLINYSTAVIFQSFVERLSRRSAGRPFGLSRGRKGTLYSLRQ
jgi:hypothetical protein